MSMTTDALNLARRASALALRRTAAEGEPPMNIEFRARRLNLTEEHRAEATRRVLFALGRFGRQVESVVLRMDDVNGPRRGSDKRFRISARLMRGQTVRIEGCHEDIYAAINQAADRLGRAVARVLGRRRDLASATRTLQPA
jgi:ribosomal subunit interface protein